MSDDYTRQKVKHFIENEKEIKSGEKELLTETQWATPSKHKHFKELQNVSVAVNMPVIGPDATKTMPYSQLATSVVRSFFQRIMPKLRFPSMITVNSSLRMTVQYMTNAAEWIYNLTQSSDVTPFQFDLCIAVGKPKTPHYDDDDDDDDDDEDEEEVVNDYVDYIGDIAEKLRTNKLRNIESKSENQNQADRIFDRLYGQFLENQGDEQRYLQSKRLISMVDRRQQAHGMDMVLADTIFMYEPPEDCKQIPKDPVPEWYFSSSRTCLLPAVMVDDDYGRYCEHVPCGANVHAQFRHVDACLAADHPV